MCEGGLLAVAGYTVDILQYIPCIDAGGSCTIFNVHGSSGIFHQFGYFVGFRFRVVSCGVGAFQETPIDGRVKGDGHVAIDERFTYGVTCKPGLFGDLPVLIVIVIHQLGHHGSWTTCHGLLSVGFRCLSVIGFLLSPHGSDEWFNGCPVRIVGEFLDDRGTELLVRPDCFDLHCILAEQFPHTVW